MRPPLPPRAAEQIAVCLAATHLRDTDRQDVAEELEAHLEDGLAGGRSVDELLHDFEATAATGALIGRSVRRRRHARRPLLRAAQAFTLGVLAVYAAVFARLHLSVAERPFASPAAAAAAWRGPYDDERSAFESVLSSMYTPGDDGRLTAAGLRAFQAWKGKLDPSLSSIVLEPAYFPNAARRGEVRREFERFLDLARDASTPAFEIERDALLADRGRALRFVALQIPIERLSQLRDAHRRTP